VPDSGGRKAGNPLLGANTDEKEYLIKVKVVGKIADAFRLLAFLTTELDVSIAYFDVEEKRVTPRIRREPSLRSLL